MIEADTKLRLQEILDNYQTGINVVGVQLQDVKAPEEVQDAFQDVLRARQERDTKENQALAYRNDIIPRSKGQAERNRFIFGSPLVHRFRPISQTASAQNRPGHSRQGRFARF